MSYSIEEHKHRYASWAASRASSIKGCRFTVLQGKILLEHLHMESLVNSPDRLPVPSMIDAEHKEWRLSIILKATEMGLPFTHGVAAKLINMYLKTVFICGGYDTHDNVAALHPPIDAVLLKSLRSEEVGGAQEHWRKAEKAKWSKFSSDEYEAVISHIKTHMGRNPLWKIEEYWQGFQ